LIVRRALRHEDGFTLIEVLVAAFVLVLGALAVFTVFSTAVKNVQRGREAQVGVSVAQREMEKARSIKFSELLMKSTPETSSETGNPGLRVNAGKTEYNLARTGTASWAKLASPGSGETGALEPKSETFSVGGTPVTVYRYVVWRKDEAFCKTFTSATEPTSCKEGKNYKRVIIDVWPSKAANQASRGAYYELQSDFVNPNPPTP
jgi:prepilin-type N-terminal cleavage/methylation domain-containing protein